MSEEIILPKGFKDLTSDELGLGAVVLSSQDYLALLPPSMREELIVDVENQRRWIGYGRYSTNLQDPDSLDRQKTRLAPFWSDPGSALVGWFDDPARSGTTMHGRRGLASALAVVRARGCDAFAVEDVDRLSRNVGQLLLMYEEMRDCGVELWDAKHGKLEWMQVYILGLMAQLGRDRLLELLSGGRDEKIKKGRLFAALIYGYVRDKQKIKMRIVDEELRPTIVWIFEAIAAGATCYQVAKDLCAKFPEPRENHGRKKRIGRYRPPFDEQFVRRLIEHPLYMGISRWKQTKQIRDFLTRKVTGNRMTPLPDQLFVQVKHLAIVSQTLWARANARLADRNPHVSTGGSVKTGPFSGCLFCSCGSPLARAGLSDAKDLRCMQQTHSYGRKKCTAIGALPAAWTEDLLIGRLLTEIVGTSQDGLFRRHVANVVDAAKKRLAEARRDATLEMRAVKRELDRLFQEDEIVGYSQEWLRARREQLEARAKTLSAQLALRDDVSRYDGVLEEIGRLDVALNEIRKRLPFKADSAEDQAFVEAVQDIVREVRIHPTADKNVLRFVMRLRCGDGPENARAADDAQLSLPLGDVFGTSDDYVVVFEADRKGARANRRTTGRLDREEERGLVAASGLHDVTDPVWQIIAPCLEGADLGRGDRIVDPRLAFDGIFFALKAGADLQKLPPRFGAANAVHLFLRRIARDGRLDKVIEALQAKAPEALEGCALPKLFTMLYPRGIKLVAGARKVSDLTDEDVRRLETAAEAETDLITKTRMLAVARRIEGATAPVVGAAFGFSPDYVSTLLSRYRQHDLQGLRVKTRLGPPSAFQPGVLADLKAFVALGFEPERPHRPLKLDRINVFLRKKNVKVSLAQLGRKLRDNGIFLDQAIAAARMKRAES